MLGGGAIYNYMGIVTITHSTLENNQANATARYAYAYGGTICNERGNVTIIDSTFTNNKAIAEAIGEDPCAFAEGGAIYNDEGNLTIIKSTLINNTATTIGQDIGAYSRGGAINIHIGNLTITESTLTNNTATTTATREFVEAMRGAIFVDLVDVSGLVCEVVGNHFEGNRATEETINLRNTETATIKDNTYKNTTIGYDFVLNITSTKTEFLSIESLPLKYDVSLINPTFYDEDILDNKDELTYEITIENAEKLNVTGLSANIKLNNYRGKYTAKVYNDIFQTSNPVEFTVLMPTSINMKIINNWVK